MRKLLIFAAAAMVSLPLAAQQPQQPQQPQPQQDQKAQNQAPQQSQSETERLRVEGAAGGTRPLPPEKREGVGAGAGPHLEHVAPLPERLPGNEPVQPDK